MKIKTKIGIDEPMNTLKTSASLSISISNINTEAEAKQILKKLQPTLVKITGQTILSGEGKHEVLFNDEQDKD